jgi:hypothetical protein
MSCLILCLDDPPASEFVCRRLETLCSNFIGLHVYMTYEYGTDRVFGNVGTKLRRREMPKRNNTSFTSRRNFEIKSISTCYVCNFLGLAIFSFHFKSCNVMDIQLVINILLYYYYYYFKNISPYKSCRFLRSPLKCYRSLRVSTGGYVNFLVYIILLGLSDIRVVARLLNY